MDNEDCLCIDMMEKPIMETIITIERPTDDSLPDKALCTVKTFTTPWYADIVNYLACGIIPPEISYQRRKKLLSNTKYYQWEDPLLYKHRADQIIIKCVTTRRDEEYSSSLL